MFLGPSHDVVADVVERGAGAVVNTGHPVPSLRSGYEQSRLRLDPRDAVADGMNTGNAERHTVLKHDVRTATVTTADDLQPRAYVERVVRAEGGRGRDKERRAILAIPLRGC